MNHGYRLRCSSCGGSFVDDGSMLACPHACDALLVTDYADFRFRPDVDFKGAFRYHRWLPVQHRFEDAGSVAVFPAPEWGRRVGLRDLWFAFSGWWPERGATLPTATFKDLEAYAVLGRLGPRDTRTLVIASAGNTAAAFARTCSAYGRACAIVVPYDALGKLSFETPLAPWVTIVAVRGDYDDAIVLSRALAAQAGFVAEGGVRNVARRDGMGVAMLAAAETIGWIPDVYVQAVGSGAGALAAFEAATRLIGDGRFGRRLPQLMLAQNRPFTPIVDSWQVGSRTLLSSDPGAARENIAAIGAKVLSNQNPPYALRGGVFEALRATGGKAFGISNGAAREAAAAFEAAEGIELESAAAVALASLPEVAANAGDRSRTVLLHLTGGLSQSRAREAVYQATAALVFDRRDVQERATVERIAAYCTEQPAAHVIGPATRRIEQPAASTSGQYAVGIEQPAALVAP